MNTQETSGGAATSGQLDDDDATADKQLGEHVQYHVTRQAFQKLASEVMAITNKLHEQYERHQVARSTLQTWTKSMTDSQVPSERTNITELASHATSAYQRSLASTPAQHSWSRKEYLQMQLDLETAEREELKLLQLADELRNSLQLDSDTIQAMPTQQQDLHVSQTSGQADSPRLDPLLEAYYDKAGDVKIWGETLVDLDLEHQADLVSRDLQLDQLYDQTISDAEIETIYADRRREIESKLDLAISEADDLKAKCLAAGLHIETTLNGIPSDLGSDDHIDFSQHQQNLEHGPMGLPLYPGFEIEHITADRQNNRSVSPKIRNEQVLAWAETVLPPPVSVKSASTRRFSWDGSHPGQFDANMGSNYEIQQTF